MGAGGRRRHRAVPWGVLESARLNDVINQIDLVEDIGMRAKLGQPYTRLKAAHWLDLLEGEVAIEALYLPIQRPRPLPGTAGRLRPYGGVDLKALVASPAGLLQPPFAARGSYVGDHLELAVTGFSGLSREPRLLAQLTHPPVAPAYDLRQQVGLDGALAFESLVLKAEGAARLHGLGLRPSWALAVGAEYTFSELLFGWDLTLIGEYVHDRRPPNTAFTILHNDLVGGFGVGFNDTKGTELLGSTSADMDTFATTLMLRGARRLDDHWMVAGEPRVFVVRDHAPEWWLQRDSYLQTSLEYWF